MNPPTDRRTNWLLSVRRAARVGVCIFFVAMAIPPGAAGSTLGNHGKYGSLDDGTEEMLIAAMEKMRGGQLDAALAELKQLVEKNPNFRLAQLMYADLLLAKSRPITDFGSLSSAPYGQIAALREEARARWRHFLTPPPAGEVPSSVVKLSSDQRHVIVVDMTNSRLYLFANKDGVPRLMTDFYATIGKKGIGKDSEGDQRTPVGVYFVTESINPKQLPDLYGDGAFPIDYPNVWDQRHGRTGYGIWLHGTPSNTFSRPPRDSDGCVIVSNRDLKALQPFIHPGSTPVILTRTIDWISIDRWKQRRSRLQGVVDKWRKDWESRKSDLYLSHYSPDYSGLGKDYDDWVKYKRRVNESKSFIRVDITDQSIFMYPGEDSVLVVTFEQDYKSEDYQRRFVKRQYWQLDKDGKWRIVYEGSVS